VFTRVWLGVNLFSKPCHRTPCCHLLGHGFAIWLILISFFGGFSCRLLGLYFALIVTTPLCSTSGSGLCLVVYPLHSPGYLLDTLVILVFDYIVLLPFAWPPLCIGIYSISLCTSSGLGLRLVIFPHAPLALLGTIDIFNFVNEIFCGGDFLSFLLELRLLCPILSGGSRGVRGHWQGLGGIHTSPVLPRCQLANYSI
jgi:hypothetical protein